MYVFQPYLHVTMNPPATPCCLIRMFSRSTPVLLSAVPLFEVSSEVDALSPCRYRTAACKHHLEWCRCRSSRCSRQVQRGTRPCHTAPRWECKTASCTPCPVPRRCRSSRCSTPDRPCRTLSHTARRQAGGSSEWTGCRSAPYMPCRGWYRRRTKGCSRSCPSRTPCCRTGHRG